MLDSVKAYAVERLAGADADEADRCRHRHLDWVVQVLLTGNLRGSDGSLWLERFEREHDNIRASLRWALEAGRVDDAATILERASRMWASRGYIAEGELWGNEVLTAANGHPAAESSARLALGWLAMQRSDVESSRGHLEVAIERARAAGDRRTLARALTTLGVLSWNFERSADAVVPSNEAREIYEELGDPYGVADAVYSVGLMTWQGKGDLEAGAALLEESVRRFRELGDRYSVAECGTCVGAAALRRGDIATCRAAFAQCARDFEEFGDYPGTVMSLGAAGGCAAWMGDLTDARDKLTASIALADRTGQPILAAFGRAWLTGISDAPPRTRAVALAAALAEVDVTAMPFANRHMLAIIVGELAAALNRWEIAVPVLDRMADICAQAPTVAPMLPPTADAALARARNALSNEDYAELCAAGPALEWEEIFSFPAAMSS